MDHFSDNVARICETFYRTVLSIINVNRHVSFPVIQVMGLPRKRNYAGRWDVLIDKSTKCLNRLLEIAAKKKRNYVLDQVLYVCKRKRVGSLWL